MGIILTKYPGTFDTSKFDFSYDSDTFPADALADMDEILLEIGDVFYLYQQTTTEDTMGDVETVTEESVRIYASIQDITKKDRQIHAMGLAVPGNSKIFMKPTYTITSGGVDTIYTPKEDDIIQDRTRTNNWRIVKILGERHVVNQQVFKVAIIKSIGLEGSS